MLYGHDEQTWDCRIIDMSETGVRLKISAECDVKTKVFLRIFNRKGIHQCELKWSDDGLIGLKFVRSSGVNDSEFNKTFNLLHAIDDTTASKEARFARLRSVIGSSIPTPQKAFI